MVACGLCHTEIHMRDNDWGSSNFPMVPGHEGVGVIQAVGSAAHLHAVGDKVGVGWARDSCGSCSNCMLGRENLCLKGYQGTFLGAGAGCWGKEPHNEHGGCFSKVMRVNEKFVFAIPEGIPAEVAAPLLCGGTTVWEPICDYVKPGTKMGVISVGGLGTEAIKLASTVGAVVTAFSRTPAKKEGALQCGANSFVIQTDDDQMEAAKGTLDFILDTCPVNTDLSTMLDLLQFGGTYCRVGLPPATNSGFSYDIIPLVFQAKKIAGSVICGSSRTKSMFEVVAANKKRMVEDLPTFSVVRMPFDQVNEAMDKLTSEKLEGYRIVLFWPDAKATLREAA
ncbi:unnamed protein product [Chrysoparadoxa australica]